MGSWRWGWTHSDHSSQDRKEAEWNSPSKLWDGLECWRNPKEERRKRAITSTRMICQIREECCVHISKVAILCGSILFLLQCAISLGKAMVSLLLFQLWNTSKSFKRTNGKSWSIMLSDTQKKIYLNLLEISKLHVMLRYITCIRLGLSNIYFLFSFTYFLMLYFNYLYIFAPYFKIFQIILEGYGYQQK